MTARLLMLLLLMPSLACAMPVCHQTKQVVSKPVKLHCAQQEQGRNTAAEGASVYESLQAPVMLAWDCMGVDFQQSPQPFEFDNGKEFIDHSDSLDVSYWLAFKEIARRFDAIRAPPQAHSNVQYLPPVYLITQRFRL